MKIVRAFPRKTKATPCDDLAFTGMPTRKDFQKAESVNEVHVSVTFTYDIPKAELMGEKWIKAGFNVKIGGPAYGDRMSESFIPGLYIEQEGYTFTSRGCPNSCWFCSVWESAKGKLIELPITPGWNILDDNILATSEQHFRDVIQMLKQQPDKPIFTGGIEAKILKPWQAELMKEVKTKRLYCAYDTPDDYEPLVEAGKMFRSAGFTTASHVLSCYVLIGYWGDTFLKAEKRLVETIKAGFVPYAMLWKDKSGTVDEDWRRFQREWCRPQIVGVKMRDYATN